LWNAYRDLISLRQREPDLGDPWLTDLRIDYDEQDRWIVLYRGALAIACNLGEAAATVPVTGSVVLAWDEPAVGETTVLPGHSFVVLRTT
jgi:maltooligosyltrehalose trehalohydrolase